MKKKYDTIEDILECSLLCRTRNEFRLKYNKAYNSARKLGVLDEVCKHMLVKLYSTPQLILKKITETIFNEKCLYNCRTLIHPYEIDVYFKNLGIAFEYNGERWHRQIKVDKHILCEDYSVFLITIIENNRDYEVDVKNQLIKHIDIINIKTKKNITIDDILNVKINYYELLPNIEQIKNKCLKYNNLGEFIKKERSLYSLLYNRNLLRDFTSHMETSRTYYKNLNIKDIVNKYKTINEFITCEPKLYQHIRKNKLNNLLDGLERDLIIWKKELILNEIKKYEFLSDFKKNSGGCYSAAIRLGLKEELKVLKKKKNEYNIDDLRELTYRYSSLTDFIKNQSKVYNYCMKNNLSYLFSHMKRNNSWTEEKLLKIINECKTIKELSIKNPNAYATIRRKYKYLLGKLERYVK